MPNLAYRSESRQLWGQDPRFARNRTSTGAERADERWTAYCGLPPKTDEHPLSTRSTERPERSRRNL